MNITQMAKVPLSPPVNIPYSFLSSASNSLSSFVASFFPTISCQIEALFEQLVVVVFVFLDDLPVGFLQDVISSKARRPKLFGPFAAMLAQIVPNLVWLTETKRDNPATQDSRHNAS
jgi:hypothetical protein